MSEGIFLPTMSHWNFGNDWSGSKGRASFTVKPADGQLHACLWTGPLCSSLCPAEETAEFPLSEEGLEQLRCWLEDGARKRNEVAL